MLLRVTAVDGEYPVDNSKLVPFVPRLDEEMGRLLGLSGPHEFGRATVLLHPAKG
jgi:hypothetical protein